MIFICVDDDFGCCLVIWIGVWIEDISLMFSKYVIGIIR